MQTILLLIFNIGGIENFYSGRKPGNIDTILHFATNKPCVVSAGTIVSGPELHHCKMRELSYLIFMLSHLK